MSMFDDPVFNTPPPLDEQPVDDCGEKAIDNADAVTPPPASQSSDRAQLDDAHMAEYISEATLSDRYCWCGGLGWMHYTGARWEPTTDVTVGEQVRLAVIELHATEARNGADSDRLKRISTLFGAGRIRAIVGLAKGVLERRPDEFDCHPDLLNAGDCVVDLTTGEARPHDPALMFTKQTPVNYRREAVHADWTAALAALPEDSVPWMQRRIGQAATGNPTPDDVMVVLQGSGANGKSTILTPIMRALGDYATAVPERVLLANPSDHPTELMTLRGARLAVMEETPEARHLNVKRLKDVLGTEVMTARYIARDTVSWSPTHSLLLASNYRPRVDEVDHGTWRRLALQECPFTFRKAGEPLTTALDRLGDPSLRDRLKRGDGGRHEAVLAWIVRGAVAHYANDRVMPPMPAGVVASTHAWRADADAVLGFIAERLMRDADAHVMSSDLLASFNGWLKERGHKEWSDQTLAGRLRDHESWRGVEYRQLTATAADRGLSRPPTTWPATSVPRRYRAWCGVRFRRDDDPDDAPNIAAQPDAAQGAQGGPAVFTRLGEIQSSDHPVHPVQAPPIRASCPCGRPAPVDPGTGLCQWCEIAASKLVESS